MFQRPTDTTPGFLRIGADLKGAHAGRYTDTLLRLADELTSEAGSMRLMAERAEEDGDE